MQIHNIGRIRKYLTENASKSVVHALVLSRLDYCNSLLCGLPHKQLVRLQGIQNICGRIVTKSRRSDHISPIFVRLHWLPVTYRIQFKVLTYTFKSIHRLAPAYLSDMISVYRPSRSLRSQDQLQLVQPRTRTKTYGDRSFTVTSPTL